MDGSMPNPPFPDACRTGRAFVTPCRAASTHEFPVDGALHLAFHVEDHGWFDPRPGRLDDINDDRKAIPRRDVSEADTGNLVEADGTEHPVRWRADRDGAGTPRKLALESAADWRQEAKNLRAMAGAQHLDAAQAETLRREADAADRQAEWWLAGGGAT